MLPIGKITHTLAGAAIGAAFYIGREIAQAEYRIIEKHYNRKRAVAIDA